MFTKEDLYGDVASYNDPNTFGLLKQNHINKLIVVLLVIILVFHFVYAIVFYNLVSVLPGAPQMVTFGFFYSFTVTCISGLLIAYRVYTSHMLSQQVV